MAEDRRRPSYNDPAERREMHRLELGEAIVTGDQDRVDEMVAAMKARGDRDVAYEMAKAESAYYRFEEQESLRTTEFKPATAEELLAKQEELGAGQGEGRAPANEAPEQDARRAGYNDLKVEQSLAEEAEASIEFYKDRHPEQDHGHDHDL